MSEDNTQRWLTQRVKCKIEGTLQLSLGGVIECCKPLICGLRINLGVCDRETCRELEENKQR